MRSCAIYARSKHVCTARSRSPVATCGCFLSQHTNWLGTWIERRQSTLYMQTEFHTAVRIPTPCGDTNGLLGSSWSGERDCPRHRQQGRWSSCPASPTTRSPRLRCRTLGKVVWPATKHMQSTPSLAVAAVSPGITRRPCRQLERGSCGRATGVHAVSGFFFLSRIFSSFSE